MHNRETTDLFSNDGIGEECDTLLYQGLGASQTQALKYVGDQKIIATTGELMWCTGRNNLPPLKVIYKLHIGTEIADVNLHPFRDFLSRVNPLKVIASGLTWGSNWLNGYHFSRPLNAKSESVVFHTPNLSQLSIGQETDIESHRKKYDAWLQKADKTKGLILWGISRGTAATFCAFAKEQYPEVKLVVLEGAIDSIDNVLPKFATNLFKYDTLARHVVKGVHAGFSFFNKHHLLQYHSDGPSPLKSVNNFPEGVPVVFITSKLDKVVTSDNTENIANALAKRGKNDVYLLTLEHSRHASYMFDNLDDRNRYETFIHAIYKAYNLKYDQELARQGEAFLDQTILSKVQTKLNQLRLVS